ncbi:thioredoxin [Cobetia crustatorum]|uniref:Thioredoxin n=2 Tax=Halomonadaceae TaxID=28256 RepID=A0A558HUY0_9GAMM|nr:MULTISPECIES: thioredoxin [Cobetia]TVU72940.1 thioredoxin [Cobetia crustatorum]
MESGATIGHSLHVPALPQTAKRIPWRNKMSNHVDVTGANFEQEVLNAEAPVLLKFWAPWCGPCKMMAPVVEEVANERGEGLKIVNVNVDDAPEIAAEQGVRGVPTVILFKSGAKVASLVGAQSKGQLSQFIEQNL